MNSKTKLAVTTGVAASALAATVALAPTAAADSQCGAGKQMFMGKCEVVTVTENVGSGKPKPGTGGLIFRDKLGSDLGSGMGQLDRFTTTGNEVKANGVHLIEVEQYTRGKGGWGSLYKGYIKAEFADINY